MAKTSDKLPISSEDGRKRGEMLQALRRHKGIVWKACQEVGITRYQHDDWMRDDPDYRATYATIKEEQKDFVESKMLERINGITATKGVADNGEPIVYEVAPSDPLIMFYLKTQAKDRGYVERQEITGADGGPVQIIAPDNI